LLIRWRKEHIIETRSKIIEDLIALTNDQFDRFCTGGELRYKEIQCRRYKLGRMTEHLITFSFIPKASKASDFDTTTISRLSKLLKQIICKCQKVSGDCGREECFKEDERFNGSIDKLVQSSCVLPGNFVAHIQNQAEK
jgi:hypothetical protein